MRLRRPGRLSAAAALVCAAIAAPVATAAAADPVIAAAGDIACPASDPLYLGGAGDATHCAQRRTAALIGPVDAVLPLGDNQYDSGRLSDYQTAYASSWGVPSLLPKTFPVVGNHEYGSPGAKGYFDYFNGVGAATGRAGARGQGWYSYDLGAWHVLALNSECDKIGVAVCATGGAQEAWVRADLVAHPTTCTLAYWHEPRFSSGPAAVTNANNMAPIWNDLYNAGVDVVLTGHKHFYERFAPLNAAGAVDTARGITELIVGTGGRDHAGTPAKRAGSQVLNAKTFGILKMALHPTSFDWQFVPETATGFKDQSVVGQPTACH